jgi:hypothetical protein
MQLLGRKYEEAAHAISSGPQHTILLLFSYSNHIIAIVGIKVGK